MGQMFALAGGDPFKWQQRSGGANNRDRLVDAQYNAICIDPENPSHIYAGSDIGIFQSTNGGATWRTFSDGLPGAPVLDLKLHQPSRLLRASTHGRGVFELALSEGPKEGIELYVRHTQLDQGRSTSQDDLDDPANFGEKVHHTRSPDIKVDTPDSSGGYQFEAGRDIDFVEFVDPSWIVRIG
jgi:hypothetical protein